MTDFICGSGSRLAFRLALTGVAAGLLAGCASSERLSDPLSNPFQTSANVSEPAPASGGFASSVPVSPVQSRPLSAPQASTAPVSQPVPRVAAVSQAPRGGVAGWSAQGGSPVVVAQGETAAVLASRYGIPVDALVKTNGFSSASQIQPGSRIVIPVYNAALAASSGAIAVRNTAASAKAVGTPPRSLASQAEALKLAKAHAPAAKTAAVEPAAKPAQKLSATPQAQKTAAASPAPSAAKPETSRTAKADPAPGAAEPAKASATTADAANPEFRWPARGRIIQAFKPGGNDGINIAVPEGTSVKAAESGVVAYAGNELKGYGNLILIRHPNGFVSAYANTSDIEVKRGETVKRGQTIAKSGQSGNVASPQLHFELRKGTTPVDPTQYLAGV
ncbi:peptidoglycan DD-metalloendopeptidase family protein [Methylocapsa sp. D3K7]|uniref:M23 family metallopeptidase n=1 Tax=Methylocapsa sp. D3K7 TaxID=3041435 RepID=UPI00244EA8BC|nr:M23 family metallopeptidase [Methylocapsa sp. D3K7]WGJ14261.1 peptidoglycan DD-metalloendopeptidase family protein [Methylocapsa sp. D3K7]